MNIPVLTTKLNAPLPRSDLVPRPHLVKQLAAGLDRKLTLLSAPAGFGKSTLLSQWAARSPQHIAWLSLDEDDNDPVRFWIYLISALRAVHEGLGQGVLEALQSPRHPPLESLLTGLINELAELCEPLAIVLDDYHVITDRDVHDSMIFTLGNLPSQIHLILSSRADPPWPMARLRAQREMAELRATDLRFTTEETASFLNDAMQLQLSGEDVAGLDKRTEGWIAGLQMAALSIRGRTDGTDFVEAFTSSNRFVLDFLVEEVLDRQSSDIQEFLLETSILDRMTAPLCDAVRFGLPETPTRSTPSVVPHGATRLKGSGDTVARSQDSQTILVQLEQANLFLLPLDEERSYYRYHHLFRDLLRKRLEQGPIDRVSLLHRRASRWYELNDLIPEAVQHSLAAGEAERVAQLVTESALTLIFYGQLLSLAGSLATTLREMPSGHPWLRVAYAWAMAYAGHLEDAGPIALEAEEALVSVEDPSEVRHIRGHIAAIRAYSSDLRGDQASSVAHAREALALLPVGELTVRAFTMSLLATALRDDGDLEGATLASAEAVAMSRRSGNSRVAVTALCEQAALQLWKGQYRKANDTCEKALQLARGLANQAGQQLPVTALIYARLSNVLQEWNDLDGALRYARAAVRLSDQWGQADISIISYSRLSSVLGSTGDLDGALEALAAARRIAGRVSPWYESLMQSWEAALRLSCGDLPEAARWMRETGLRADDEFTHDSEGQYRILARVLIAQGDLDKAKKLLLRLQETSELLGAMPQLVGVLTLQALALQARGEQEKAVAALGRAVTLAEPEGLVRTFVSGGTPMAGLLAALSAKGTQVDYVGRLLAAHEAETGIRRPASSLVEPLSEREVEVLRLLSTHLTSTDIAGELFISVNTVRSHIKSIYGKLGTHSRRETVDRSRDLGLL